MSEFEKLCARLKKLMAENPGRVIHMDIVVDTDGQPFCWIPSPSSAIEGNDNNLIRSKLKPHNPPE